MVELEQEHAFPYDHMAIKTFWFFDIFGNVQRARFQRGFLTGEGQTS